MHALVAASQHAEVVEVVSEQQCPEHDRRRQERAELRTMHLPDIHRDHQCEDRRRGPTHDRERGERAGQGDHRSCIPAVGDQQCEERARQQQLTAGRLPESLTRHGP